MHRGRLPILDNVPVHRDVGAEMRGWFEARGRHKQAQLPHVLRPAPAPPLEYDVKPKHKCSALK